MSYTPDVSMFPYFKKPLDWKKMYQKTLAEKKVLKQENEELKKYKTMIHCVWSDLYWADKAGCDVSFKDISASCDYYDNEDYVKKEVVCDKEEED